MKILLALLFSTVCFGQLPSGWSWVNQSSPAATLDTTSGWYMQASTVSGTHSAPMVVESTVTPPYSVTLGVSGLGVATNQWDIMTGLVWRESSTGRLTTCEYESWSGTYPGWYANAVYWISPTSPSSVVSQQNYRLSDGSILIRAGDDGTYRTCDVSHDAGAHWVNFYKQARAANMTANQIGFFIDNWAGTNVAPYAGLLESWNDWNGTLFTPLAMRIPAPGLFTASTSVPGQQTSTLSVSTQTAPYSLSVSLASQAQVTISGTRQTDWRSSTPQQESFRPVSSRAIRMAGSTAPRGGRMQPPCRSRTTPRSITVLRAPWAG